MIATEKDVMTATNHVAERGDSRDLHHNCHVIYVFFYPDRQYQSSVKSLEQAHEVWEQEMEVTCDVSRPLEFSLNLV